jgi:hypothetical protein
MCVFSNRFLNLLEGFLKLKIDIDKLIKFDIFEP